MDFFSFHCVLSLNKYAMKSNIYRSFETTSFHMILGLIRPILIPSLTIVSHLWINAFVSWHRTCQIISSNLLAFYHQHVTCTLWSFLILPKIVGRTSILTSAYLQHILLTDLVDIMDFNSPAFTTI